MRVLANQSVKALRTNINNPKVIKVIGKVKKPKMGRTSALTSPMTMAARRAVAKFLIKKPGTILAVISNATAVLSQVNKKCIISFLTKYCFVSH